MYDLVLKNCTIVNEKSIFESDIAIKNDRIESIASDISTEAKEIIDLNGNYVFPGFIDDQVHFREPGLTHKGDIASESFAGLAGGVTSYFEMPNVNPTTTTLENLDKKFELAKQRSFSNYSFYLGASNTNIEEIKKVDPNLASGLKVFMASRAVSWWVSASHVGATMIGVTGRAPFVKNNYRSAIPPCLMRRRGCA